MKRIKKPIVPESVTANSDDNSEGQPKKITKLAIGVEGGFNPDAEKNRFELEEINTLVVMPGFIEVSLLDPELPQEVQMSVAGILAGESAEKRQEIEAAADSWDGEKRMVSKHALNLQQLGNGKKIPPKGWKCEQCDPQRQSLAEFN